jgi:heme exporter protein C
MGAMRLDAEAPPKAGGAAGSVRPRRGTGDRVTLILGLSALAAIGLTAGLGLVVSPPDQNQGDLVRLIYVHPGAATACYVAFGMCAVASLAYLWPRTRSRRWDRLAAASAEVGVVFCAVTLVTGSIWGRGSWGVWWTWDARLTLTALLFAVFVGYLALRRTGGDPDSRARRCAIVAVLCALLVPVDHEATTWWQTLHQGNTLLRANPLIHGWQLVSMLVSFVAYALVLSWLLIHRYRVEVLEDRVDDEGFALALAERRAEGAATPVASSGDVVAPAGSPAAPFPTPGADSAVPGPGAGG